MFDPKPGCCAWFEEHTRLQGDQLGEAARLERQFLHLRAVDRGPDIGRGRIHLRHLALDLHGFRNGPHDQVYIESQGLAGAQLHAGLLHLLEAGFLEFEPVFAGRDLE